MHQYTYIYFKIKWNLIPLHLYDIHILNETIAQNISDNIYLLLSTLDYLSCAYNFITHNTFLLFAKRSNSMFV